METLNYDVLERISEFLQYKDFVSFIKTCKKTNELKHDLTKKTEYLEELKEQKGLSFRLLSSFAAMKGLLDVVKYLSYKGYVFDAHAMHFAAGYGHLDIVKWLYENKTEKSAIFSINIAASNGKLEVVKWLFENINVSCSEWSIVEAHKNHHHEMVQYLHEKYGFKIPQ